MVAVATARKARRVMSGRAVLRATAPSASVRVSDYFSATRFTVRRGNTEGTPTRARESTSDQSFSDDSSDSRDFFGLRDPSVPAVPSLVLHGKEGVDGSSPPEGSKSPQTGAFCCLDCYDGVPPWMGGSPSTKAEPDSADNGFSRPIPHDRLTTDLVPLLIWGQVLGTFFRFFRSDSTGFSR